MESQWLLVFAAASLAAVYIGRQTWRTWSGGCGKGCGCSSPPKRGPSLIGADELTRRARLRAPR